VNISVLIKRSSSFGLWLTCIGLAWVSVNADAVAQSQAFFAKQVWTGQGQPIENGVMLVEGGKIQFVGPAQGWEIPAGCEVHRLGSASLIPGLVVAETTLAETGQDDEQAITPQITAADGFDFFDKQDKLLAAGVTTVQISPGSRRLMPGQGSVVKLAGDDVSSRVLRRQESLRILLTAAAFNPPTIYQPPVGAVSEERPLMPTNPQLAGSLGGAVSGLRALFQAALDLNDAGKASLDEQATAVISAAIKDDYTFRITAKSGAEIQAARRLAEQFGLKVLLVQPSVSDAMMGIDWNSPKFVGTVLSPGLRPGVVSSVSTDPKDPPETAWEIAQHLLREGATQKIAICVESDSDLDDLMFLAAMFKQAGLTDGEVLKMVTSNPAHMLGVADRVGTLAAEMDADFVVLSGQPFASGTRVLATYVDGQKRFQQPQTGLVRVVKAGAVYTADGMIPGGSVAVMDGKICGIGVQVSADKQSAQDEFPNAVIVPGFIDSATGLGLGAAIGDRIGLDVKLGDFLMAEDESIQAARRGGITTALLSSTSLPSPVVAFKLGDQPRVVKDPVAIRFSITGNLTSAEENLRKSLASAKAYHESWEKYDAQMVEYRQQVMDYEKAKAKYEAGLKAEEAKKAAEAAAKAKAASAQKDSASIEATKKEPGTEESSKEDSGKPDSGKPDSGKPDSEKADSEKAAQSPASATPVQAKPVAAGSEGSAKTAVDPNAPVAPKEPTKPKLQAELEPYRRLFKQELVAIVETSDALSIGLALKIFRDEFGVPTVISGDDGLEVTAAAIAAAGASFVVGPTFVGTVDGEEVNYAQRLSSNQIPFAFQSKATTGSAQLPLAVAYAVHQGLGGTDALRGFTSGAAALLKLPGVGQLKLGGDADLVVLSGKPFEPSTQVLAVMIDGQWVYKKEIDQ